MQKITLNSTKIDYILINISYEYQGDVNNQYELCRNMHAYSISYILYMMWKMTRENHTRASPTVFIAKS